MAKGDVRKDLGQNRRNYRQQSRETNVLLKGTKENKKSTTERGDRPLGHCLKTEKGGEENRRNSRKLFCLSGGHLRKIRENAEEEVNYSS